MHPQSSHNGVVKIKLPVGTILTHCEGNETLLMGKQGQLLVSSVDNVSGKQ